MKTRKQALLNHLLKGGKLSIKNAYLNLGISNISREVRRLIETPLGISLERKMCKHKNIYGNHSHWFEYRLKRADFGKVKKAILTAKT